MSDQCLSTSSRTYSSGWCKSAVHVEQADCVLDWSLCQRRNDCGCYCCVGHLPVLCCSRCVAQKIIHQLVSSSGVAVRCMDQVRNADTDLWTLSRTGVFTDRCIWQKKIVLVFSKVTGIKSNAVKCVIKMQEQRRGHHANGPRTLPGKVRPLPKYHM